MNDDEVIRQRVSGRSTRAIAKAQATTVAEVNKAIDRFAEMTIDANVRKHTLALELARLDELQEVFYERALQGDCDLFKANRPKMHHARLISAATASAANC